MIQTNTTFAITLCEVVVYFLMQNYNCHHCKDHPGKKVRRDPANPVWDPGWDPDRDFGTSHMGSRQSHPGSQLHSRQNPAWNLASNPRWDPSNPTRDPSFVPCKIPPIPPSNLCFSRVGSRQSHLGSQICTM